MISIRTNSFDKYKQYIENKLRYFDELCKLYTDRRFRQYQWYLKIGRKRSEDKLLNRIEKHYGKDVMIVMGDASIGVNMRNFISTPNITLNRVLKRRFNVKLLDEFRTSKINANTHKKNEGNFRYKDKIGKIRKVHAVLKYTTEQGYKGYINRDKNAVKNNEYLYNHLIRYKKGLEIEERPEIFQRPKQQNGITEEEINDEIVGF